MPFTPYHFGPSGFLGLIFKRWLDLPVFLLANVAIDLEVLFGSSRFPHQSWHFHTLLIGGVVGAVLGLAMFPFRGFFGKVMELLRVPYKTGLKKMVISGVLGAWLHVVIDSFYHWDVEVFWPSKIKPLWKLVNPSFGSISKVQNEIRVICLWFLAAAVVVYGAGVLRAYLKQKKAG